MVRALHRVALSGMTSQTRELINIKVLSMSYSIRLGVVLWNGTGLLRSGKNPSTSMVGYFWQAWSLSCSRLVWSSERHQEPSAARASRNIHGFSSPRGDAPAEKAANTSLLSPERRYTRRVASEPLNVSNLKFPGPTVMFNAETG